MSSKGDLNLALIGEDFTRPATDSAGNNFDRLAKKVDGFGSSVHKNSTSSQKDMETFSRLVSGNLKDGETAFQSLQRAIGDTESKVKSLRAEFAQAGSQGSFLNLKGAEADLKSLVGFAKDIEPEFGKAGASVSQSFSTGFLEDFADTPIGPAIAAYAVGPLAVIAGAAIATGLTTALGFGFLAAGAFVLRGNKELAADFGALQSDIASELTDSASALVAPFQQAISNIDSLLQSEKPEFTAIFSSVAPAVASVESIIEAFVRSIVPKLAPIGKVFSEAFDDPQVKAQINLLVGEVGSFFTLIAKNKNTITDTFTTLVAFVNAGVIALNALLEVSRAADAVWRSTGIPGFLEGLSRLHQAADSSGSSINALALAGHLAATEVDNAAQAAAKAAPDYAKLSSVINSTVATADTLAGAMTDKVLSSILSTDQATLHWYESLTTLSSTLKDNKNALSIHTAAGQADREAILGVVQANIAQYDAMINSGISAVDAAKAYDKNFSSLEHLKGLTAAQQKTVDGLIGSYKKVPDKVNTTLAVNGLTAAITDLANLIRQLNGLPLKKTVSINVKYSSSGSAGPLPGLTDIPSIYAAGNYWQPAKFADGGGYKTTEPARTPTTVNVDNKLSLNIDGRPIRAYTVREIAANNRRQKVGTR